MAQEAERRALAPLFEQLARDPVGYTLRRYYVDEFHLRHIPTLPSASRVLDLGGHKDRKRGCFDIRGFDLQVTTVNLSNEKGADVVADAACMPFPDGAFDAVICSELLEHVPDPAAVIREATRVLRSGGIFLACSPFLYHIHGDPYDFGRYTHQFWREQLVRNGYGDIAVEAQGGYWSVMNDLVRLRMSRRQGKRKIWSWPVRTAALAIFKRWKLAAIRWDSAAGNAAPAECTTGFGFRAVKR